MLSGLEVMHCASPRGFLVGQVFHLVFPQTEGGSCFHRIWVAVVSRQVDYVYYCKNGTHDVYTYEKMREIATANRLALMSRSLVE